MSLSVTAVQCSKTGKCWTSGIQNRDAGVTVQPQRARETRERGVDRRNKKGQNYREPERALSANGVERSRIKSRSADRVGKGEGGKTGKNFTREGDGLARRDREDRSFEDPGQSSRRPIF